MTCKCHYSEKVHSPATNGKTRPPGCTRVESRNSRNRRSRKGLPMSLREPVGVLRHKVILGSLCMAKTAGALFLRRVHRHRDSLEYEVCVDGPS